eukprot:gene5166-5404_t
MAQPPNEAANNATAAAGGASSAPSGVFINGQLLSNAQVQQLQQQLQVVISPGQFWYESVAGAYGCVGGPTTGPAPPGMQAGEMEEEEDRGA